MKYYCMASFKIQDFKKFIAEFDAAQDLLNAWGFKRNYVNRDADDPSRMIVVHECEDLQRAREFYQSDDFMQCMKQAGVLGEPQLTFMEELVRTPQVAPA